MAGDRVIHDDILERPMKIKALAPWFGSNRMLGEHVGSALNGCNWVAVLFAGGLCEVPHIKARTIVVNDLHRHAMNLAWVAADPRLGPMLYRRLRRLSFHPDTLTRAQAYCASMEHDSGMVASSVLLEWAQHYFVASWMGRNGKAGTSDEFSGGLALRFNANGGDSCTRYQNAVKSLVEWRRVLARCTFSVMDAFELLDRCEDSDGHAIYADPPFFGPGKAYKHNCGDSEADQVAWHTRLRDHLARFEHTRVVCRFYDVELIRKLYADHRWNFVPLTGRKSTNGEAPEVLVMRN